MATPTTAGPLRRVPVQGRSVARVARMLDACADLVDEVGYDGLTTTMLAERAGLSDRIRLQQCDAKHTPFADGEFAAVISNSIVHHIPEPKLALAEMVRVAAAGAVLFVRDLLRPGDDTTLAALVERYAGDANAHQQQMFKESLHAALSLGEIRALVQDLGFEPATAQQTTDRHWTWIART